MLNLIKIAVASLVLYPLAASAQFFNDFDQPPHDYWTAEMHDPMTELLRSVSAGDVKLGDEPGLPLVRRLLDELEIPVESQTLVFSRTSLQRGAVSPANPRAIYFNEETYLGWMPGGRVEIASSDPERGAVFFFQRERDRREGPLFVRDKVCIQCHAGSATNFLPGLLGKSVYPDARGRSLKSIDSFERVGHEVPLRERWGGWYVSGAHGALRHMGNSLARRGAGGVELVREAKADLGKLFDQSNYPVGGSDVVALLVLDHQISMHFELMEAHYIARQAIADLGAEKVPLPAEVAVEIDAAAERVVGYLLFQNEADLGETAIAAEEAFQKSFLANRRADAKGRSLKDFQLQGRLFKHRCSYMIYSKSFTGLPEVLKGAIFRRLKEVLRAEGGVDGFEHLADAERVAILDILKATLPDFAG